jgi:hypothetical protein
MTARALAMVGLLGLTACAMAGRGTSRDRNVIGFDEISTIQVETAYDVVSRLRADFLKGRGTVTRTTSQRPEQVQPSITVFVDGIESGPVERTLHLIPAIEVQEIRLYRATDAATKFGSRHNGGVIEVTMRRHDPPAPPQ